MYTVYSYHTQLHAYCQIFRT